jgi:hypothetical protein
MQWCNRPGATSARGRNDSEIDTGAIMGFAALGAHDYPKIRQRPFVDVLDPSTHLDQPTPAQPLTPPCDLTHVLEKLSPQRGRSGPLQGRLAVVRRVVMWRAVQRRKHRRVSRCQVATFEFWSGGLYRQRDEPSQVRRYRAVPWAARGNLGETEAHHCSQRAKKVGPLAPRRGLGLGGALTVLTSTGVARRFCQVRLVRRSRRGRCTITAACAAAPAPSLVACAIGRAAWAGAPDKPAVRQANLMEQNAERPPQGSDGSSRSGQFDLAQQVLVIVLWRIDPLRYRPHRHRRRGEWREQLVGVRLLP